MKRRIKLLGTSIAVMLLCLDAAAQFQFEQVPSGEGADFELTGNNGVAFSDIDGDGDDDVIVSGLVGFSQSTHLYQNDGGSFTLIEDTPFPGTVGGSIDFSDIDGDGDEDVVICGLSGSPLLLPSTRLFMNLQGSFTEVENTGLEQVGFGVPLFADIDNDGDEDLLLTGDNQTTESFSHLYSNDGGTFTLLENMNLIGAIQSAAAFADIDGDGDQDLVISGYESSANDPSTNLYRNESGVFSMADDIDLTGLRSGAVDFSDVDNDGDQDLFIIGMSSDGPAALLYLNDGGDFTLDETNSFEGLSTGDALFGDLDGDGDEDLITSGADLIAEEATFLYSNDQGTFTLVENSPFANLQQTTINFSDVDNDDDLDVLLTGLTFVMGNEVFLYSNNTPQGPTGLLEVDVRTFKITPNPTSGMAVIDLSEIQTDQIHMHVHNTLGKLVHQEVLNNSPESARIDLSTLENGVYLISFDDRDGTRMVSKVVKTK